LDTKHGVARRHYRLSDAWIFDLEPTVSWAVSILHQAGVDLQKLRPLLIKHKRGRKPKLQNKLFHSARGRPRKWGDRDREGLVEIIDDERLKIEAQGRKATDQEALKGWLLLYVAPIYSKQPRIWVSQNIGIWRNQLTLGRKAAIKIPRIKNVI
jgi:hypothetical protein